MQITEPAARTVAHTLADVLGEENLEYPDLARIWKTTERNARRIADRLSIPYVRIAGVRYFSPVDVKAALEKAKIKKPMPRRRIAG